MSRRTARKPCLGWAPRHAPNPSSKELGEIYAPAPREIELAGSATRGGGSMLGFLVMLKSFQRLGYFPKPDEVPEAVVEHVRSRLGLGPEARAVPPPRSRARYRDAIRRHLGVKAYGDGACRAAAEAVAEAAVTMDDPADLVNVAVQELVKEGSSDDLRKIVRLERWRELSRGVLAR